MIEEINKKWVLNKRPEGMPDDDCWKLWARYVPSLTRLEEQRGI